MTWQEKDKTRQKKGKPKSDGLQRQEQWPQQFFSGKDLHVGTSNMNTTRSCIRIGMNGKAREDPLVQRKVGKSPSAVSHMVWSKVITRRCLLESPLGVLFFRESSSTWKGFREGFFLDLLCSLFHEPTADRFFLVRREELKATADRRKPTQALKRLFSWRCSHGWMVLIPTMNKM